MPHKLVNNNFHPSLVTFTKKIIFFLFHFLLFTLPFIFTWVNDELFEFNKMLFVYSLTTLIAATWISRMIVEKRLIWQKTFLDLPLLLFFLSQLISTIFSLHPQTSIFGFPTRLHGGLLSTISYLVLYFAFVSNITKKQLHSLFLILLSSLFLVSSYAIPEHFGHSFSCLQMTHQFNASCWKQDVVTRIFGTFGQPNWLAAYLVTVLPLSISLYLIQKPKTKVQKSSQFLSYLVTQFTTKYLIPLTSLLAFSALIFTKSRSGFLAFAAGIGVYLVGLSYLVWQAKNKTNQFKNLITPFWFLISGFLIFALAIGTPYSPSLSDIFNPSSSIPALPAGRLNPKLTLSEQVASEPAISDSGEIRKIVWRGSFEVWRRYPLFGSGVETFAYSYYLDRPIEHNQLSEWDFLYNKAHNEFLNFLATTGIIGLSTYLLFIFVFVKKSLTVFLTNRPNHPIIQSFSHKLIILGLLSGYLALMISNFFGFSTVTVGVLFFLYPAFFVILTTKELRNLETKKLSVPKSLSCLVPQLLNYSITQFTLIILIILSTLYILFSIFQTWLADYRFATAKSLSQAGYTQTALEYLHSTINLSPSQADYYDELANESGELALTLTQIEKPDTELITNLVTQAQLASDIALQLNPAHLSLYKSRLRLYLRLSILNPQFLELAEQTSQIAIQLAPTDPKTYYYAARTQELLGKQALAIKWYEELLTLKPDYPDSALIKNKITTLEASTSTQENKL